MDCYHTITIVALISPSMRDEWDIFVVVEQSDFFDTYFTVFPFHIAPTSKIYCIPTIKIC